MKKYELGIAPNAWNALRYVIFSLLLIPLAEKLWAWSHAKRVGRRLMRGHRAQLQHSSLAYWELHQEVDKRSSISKALTVAITVLHIVGILLLEYGSDVSESVRWQRAVVSPAVRDEGHLRSDGMYFFDASFVHGRPYSSSECTDGSPRDLADFGLKVDKVHPVMYARIIKPQRSDENDYSISFAVQNSGNVFEIIGNETARFYRANRDSVVYVNKTAICWSIVSDFYGCIQNKGKVDYAGLAADTLAVAAYPDVRHVNDDWILQNRKVSARLDRLRFVWGPDPYGNTTVEAQTTWLRGGLDPEEIPEEPNLKLLSVKVEAIRLRPGCNHKHAIPLTFCRLTNLKVSKPTFLKGHTLIYFNEKQTREHKLVVHVQSPFAQVGLLTQTGNEHCAFFKDDSICVTSVSSNKHEVTYYTGPFRFSRKEFGVVRAERTFRKQFNFTVYGHLRKGDAIDLAVQTVTEVTRLTGTNFLVLSGEKVRRISLQIQNGHIVSGLVRRMGPGVPGNSLSSTFETATINTLGILRATILALLVATPLPLLHVSKDGFYVDVESSYRRGVMELHGTRTCMEVPDTAPTIVAKEINDGTLWNISHTYKT